MQKYWRGVFHRGGRVLYRNSGMFRDGVVVATLGPRHHRAAAAPPRARLDPAAHAQVTRARSLRVSPYDLFPISENIFCKIYNIVLSVFFSLYQLKYQYRERCFVPVSLINSIYASHLVA